MTSIKYIMIIIFIFTILSCGGKVDDKNDLGLITKLPKGEYVIWNYGSRHIVKCLRVDGKYYYLNDTHFKSNGIDARGAHEFYDKTTITIN